MSQHPRETNPVKWAIAQNMVLAICLKAALSKLDPEVSREVARALTEARNMLHAHTEDSRILTAVAAELTVILFPEPP